MPSYIPQLLVNGVVIITTKQGKAGKAKVDVSLSASYSKVTKRLDFLNTDNPVTDAEEEAFRRKLQRKRKKRNRPRL